MKIVCAVLTALTVAILLLPRQDYSVAAATSCKVQRVDADFTTYCVAADDIDGDGKDEIIAGSFDHKIHVLKPCGTVLWSCAAGGLPYSLATGDVNGDGKKEIAAVVQDSKGSVCLYEYKKGVLWRFSDDRPFLCIAMGDFENDGRKEVAVGSFLGSLYILDASNGAIKMRKDFASDIFISAVSFGDIDGRPGDELVLGTSKKGLFAIDGRGKILWRKKPKSLGIYEEKGSKRGKSRHPHGKMENVQSICVTDLTGDGKTEVIVGSAPCGLVTVLARNGDKIWQKSFPQIANLYSSCSVAVGNFVGDMRKELFCLFNGWIRSGQKGTSPGIMLRSDGNEIGSYWPQSSFFSICRAQTDRSSHEKLVMSSSARGRGVNVVSFDKEGQDELSAYRDSAYLSIEPELLRFKRSATSVPVTKMERTFHFLYRCNYKDIYGRVGEDLKRFLSPLYSVPGDNAVVVTSLYEKSLSQRLVRGIPKKFVEKERILEIAAWFEEHRVPFFLDIGKHAKLYFSPDTLEKVLQRARRSCRGFIVDENNYTKTDLWRGFLYDLDRILSMLAKYPGKKLIMNEYLGFWHRFPLDMNSYNTLFKPQYRDVLVPVYKPNNMKSPELNLGVLVGLWKAGVIKNWGVGVYADMWKWAPVFIGAPGDVVSRFALEGISLGANYFVFARNVSQDSKVTLDLDPGYKAYFNVLYDLVSKRVIKPIEGPQHLFVSSFALQEAANPMEVQKRAAGNKIYWQEIYRMRGPLDTGFILQAIRKNYIPGYFYDMKNYYDGLFPKNPYGYVSIFPETIDPLSVEGVEECWVVKADGSLYRREGKAATKPLQSRTEDAMAEALKKFKQGLPFTTPDAFLSTQRTREGYLVYLINPNSFNSQAVKAVVSINTHEKIEYIIDAISGKELTRKGNTLELVIPESLFRIVRIIVAERQSPRMDARLSN